ncbi:S26 family signal peptidase [Streptomyces lasalocidi]
MAGSTRGRGLGVSALVAEVLGLVLAVGAVVWLRASYGVSTLGSDSMGPTYARGTGIVWERVDGSEVRRGDVVVFTPPAVVRDRRAPGEAGRRGGRGPGAVLHGGGFAGAGDREREAGRGAVRVRR